MTFFWELESRKKVMFILLRTIGNNIGLYKLATLLLYMDPRQWSLRLKKGEGQGRGTMQSFIQLLFLIIVLLVRVPIATKRMKPPLLQKCEVWFLKIILRKCLNRHFFGGCNLHLWFPHHSFPWFSYFLHFFSIKSLHGYILTISWNMDKTKWKKGRKERRNKRKKERKGGKEREAL